MTALGIDMTDKDPVYGWADIQPEARPQMPPAVENARNNWLEAMRDVDRLTDAYEGFLPETQAAITFEANCRDEYHRLFDLWQRHYFDEILPDELLVEADREAQEIIDWIGE